jgi:DNA-binding transcriptional ArsR family regulator
LSDASTKRLLWWLLVGTRGGPTRVRLLRVIVAKPLNAHQLAKELGMDYTTIRHHLDILVKHNVVEAVGESYGAVFYPSNWLTQKTEVLAEILDESRKK